MKVLTYLLAVGFLWNTEPVFAQLPTLSLPSCFITGSGGTVANVNLPVGSLCISKGELKKLFKPCNSRDATSLLDFSRCIKKATKKELVASLQIMQAGDYQICPSGGSGGCHKATIEKADISKGEAPKAVSH